MEQHIVHNKQTNTFQFTDKVNGYYCLPKTNCSPQSSASLHFITICSNNFCIFSVVCFFSLVRRCPLCNINSKIFEQTKCWKSSRFDVLLKFVCNENATSISLICLIVTKSNIIWNLSMKHYMSSCDDNDKDKDASIHFPFPNLWKLSLWIYFHNHIYFHPDCVCFFFCDKFVCDGMHFINCVMHKFNETRIRLSINLNTKYTVKMRVCLLVVCINKRYFSC